MQPRRMPWFRAYASEVDDPNIRLLAFEDRWHFHALKCLKSQGVLDAGDHPEMLRRKVAVKLGLQLRELEAAADRIAEVGLIDPETFQPLDWAHQQFRSDTDPTATQRKRDWREAQKKNEEQKQREEQQRRSLDNQQLAVVTDMSRVTDAGQPSVTSVTSQNVTRTETTTTKAKASKTTTTTTGLSLDWSATGLKSFTEEDRDVVVDRLNGHSQEIQQDVLDELAGHIEDGVVKNSPMGLLSKLSAEARTGGFALNRGRRIRDARIAKAAPATKRAPGENTESPYENAVNFARQTFGPDAAEPNKAEFAKRLADAAEKWPEEAKKNSVAASTYGKRDERKQSR